MTPALESKKGFDPRDADAGASQEHKSVDQTIREARDTVRTGAEPARQTADTAADVTRRTADQGREAVMSGLRAMAGAQGPLAEASYSQGRQFLEASAGITKAYRETTESTAEDVQALVSSYAHFGLGLQQMQHAYFDLARSSFASSRIRVGFASFMTGPGSCGDTTKSLRVRLYRLPKMARVFRATPRPDQLGSAGAGS